MKADVKVSGNSIGGRQGWAWCFNSGECKVLDVDLDRPQEYDTFKKYGAVRVGYLWKSRNLPMHKDGTLEWSEESGWFIGSCGTFLSDRFGYSDMKELLEGATAPFIEKGNLICLCSRSDSERKAMTRLYRVGRVDSQCQHVCSLTPLTEDEMQEVVEKVNRWVNR